MDTIRNVQRVIASLPVPLSAKAWLVQELVFHVFAYAFELADRYALLPIAKVRSTERKTYSQLLSKVLLNQVLVLLPSMMLAEYLEWCFTGPDQLSPLRFALNIPAMALGHDAVQYLAHRYLLHQPNIKLLRLLRHGVHHSTGATQAISACYMSVPDFFLEIILPYLLPLALVGGGGSDARFHMFIAGAGAIGGLYEHSGYDFSAYLPVTSIRTASSPDAAPSKEFQLDKQRDEELGPVLSRVVLALAGFLDNRAHSQHHTRANVSFSDGFGSPGVFDWLLKTRWDMVPSTRSQLEREWQSQRSGGDAS